ncbi:hypothetical protein DPMN_171635 [Dreissena polymorpha]|uniref:Uncharacterized protein n=1 Tax=Dreissena polymorpha TaxID=45954 RepID=A0A9D4E0T0_DREPO|nr:hypothetical protein DPMN_171635 [Dreissena polymorpha]
MNCNITKEEVAQRGYTDKQWMDSAAVDARSFLHYLQYLTYGGLGERHKQLHTLGVLKCYMGAIRNDINSYHCETSLNLLGHCYEMERYYEHALSVYEVSLSFVNPNNAANWHIRRVLSLLNG